MNVEFMRFNQDGATFSLNDKSLKIIVTVDQILQFT